MMESHRARGALHGSCADPENGDHCIYLSTTSINLSSTFLCVIYHDILLNWVKSMDPKCCGGIKRNG